ncbi:MAG: aminotransferase class III-fold pyridoxal phosphate-dependent enzyme, partial [Verrucomicrobiota bacterium]
MSSERTNELRALDRAHFWHPFTPMEAWCEPDHEAVVLEKGEGARLTDTEGRAYLDGNSSIWTNIHGHGHPRIVAAIQEQAAKLAHASTLGFTNGPAAELAAALVGLFPEGTFSRAFFSDNGSTAVECACKMALQHWQLRGKGERDTFVAFEGAYHGDTAGAASLGGIATFHGRFGRWGWTVEHCASVQELEERIEGSQIAAVVVEPVIQGAAGMRLWPEGTLRQLREWCDEKGTFLLLDEVMTGFG